VPTTAQVVQILASSLTLPNSNEAYGWHFQYLTVIALALAFLTFCFGSLADVTLSPRLFLVKNILSVCSAPLEVLISTLYWSLRAIDPKLVVPEEMDLPLLPGQWLSPGNFLVAEMNFVLLFKCSPFAHFSGNPLASNLCSPRYWIPRYPFWPPRPRPPVPLTTVDHHGPSRHRPRPRHSIRVLVLDRAMLR